MDAGGVRSGAVAPDRIENRCPVRMKPRLFDFERETASASDEGSDETMPVLSAGTERSERKDFGKGLAVEGIHPPSMRIAHSHATETFALNDDTFADRRQHLANNRRRFTVEPRQHGCHGNNSATNREAC